MLEDFGVCELADLLSDVPEGHLETSGEGSQLIIALPKKNRSADEIIRTKRFGREVADLLHECDKYSLPFTSFRVSTHFYCFHVVRLYIEYGLNLKISRSFISSSFWTSMSIV